MQTSVTFFSAFHTFEDRLVLVKFSLCDGYINSDNVLPDDPASTNIEVSERNVSENEDEHVYAWESANTYPTSELPMRPSFSPTAFPCANSVRYA